MKAKQQNLVRQAVRGALVAGASAAVIAAPAALAQAKKTTKLQKIEVVGSRILRTSTVTAQPVVVLTRQQLNLTGEVTIGNILQSISQSGAAINTQTNNGNDGDTFVDLHNLGAARVLVLVNGHRWIPTLGGPVDLSTIPSAIISRVEILLDGASPIYGSDAIAGVINIITMQNFNGAEAHAYMGIYQENQASVAANPTLGITTAIPGATHWTGKVQEYDFTIGASNSKEGAILSVGYREQAPIQPSQTTMGQLPVIGTGVLLGNPFTAGGEFVIDGQYGPNTLPGRNCLPAGTPGASPSNGSSGCNLAGPLNGPFANPSNFTAADNWNWAHYYYLLTPSEQWYAYTQAHYRFNSHLEFDSTILYNDRSSVSQLAATPLVMGAFGAIGYGSANGVFLGVSATNPYNPFGVDLVPYLPGTAGYANWCKLYGTPNCLTKSDAMLFMTRRMLETGDRVFATNVQTYFFEGGLKGYFRAIGHDWNWNIHYSYGNRNNMTTDLGLEDTPRMQLALGPLSTCQTTPGCVPLDLFGGYNLATGQGTISPAAANYISYTSLNEDAVTQRDYSANLTGTIVDLPAGPLGVAVGYEYLEDNGYFTPDPLIAIGDSTTNIAEPTQGREAQDGEYIEFDVPLVRDVFLVHHLSFDVAERWTQATWQGFANPITPIPQKFAHNSSGRLAIKYAPIRSLLIRASWSQGFRIPTISDFFAGQGQSFDPLVDPCVAQPTLPNCPAHAVQVVSQLPVTVGGNANLTPERAISRTVGLVYSPNYIPGFNISADYYKVEVVNAITPGGIGPQNILAFCYSAVSLDCNLIQRANATYSSNGAITDILSLNQNVGAIKTEGWDVNLNYRLPSTPIGDFSVQADLSFTQNFVISNLGLSSTGVPTEFTREVAGSVTSLIPKHKYNIYLDWDYGPWSANWTLNILGPMYEECQNSGAAALISIPEIGTGWCSDILSGPGSAHPNGPFEGLNQLGTTVYNNIQVTYNLATWNTDFTLGVRNLFNKNPPISMTAFKNSYQPFLGYQVPGRFIYGRIGVRF
jgi:outer membrane receptor protein involved in Fe transport